MLDIITLNNHRAKNANLAMERQARGFAVIRALILVLVLGGLVGWGWLARGGATSHQINPDDLYEVKKRSFDVNVIAEGELMAKEREEIRSPLERSSEIIFLAKEGETVSEGDLLVKFNDAEMRDTLEKIELEVQNLKDTLIREKRDSDIEIAKERSDLEAAQVAFELTKLDFEKWKNGDVIQKKRDLNLALEKAQREEKRAAENVVLSKQLFEQEFISEQELEDDRIRQLETVAATKTAQMNIEIYNNYTLKKEKQQKDSDLSQGEARVNRAQAALENVKAREFSQVSNAQYRLDEKKERLKEIKAELANTELRAPKDGLIIYATSVGRSRYSRDKPIAEGATVKYNEAIIYLPDTSQMQASVKVHEAFLRYVVIDQQANVSIDARPDTFVKGKVGKIAVAPEPTSWYDPNIREYRIALDLDQKQAAELSLKPGMRANALIHIEKVSDVIAAPVQAVETIGARNFIYVLENRKDTNEATKSGRTAPAGDGVRMVEVTLGAHSDLLVEVRSGLKVGDQILLRKPTSKELLNPDEFKQSGQQENSRYEKPNRANVANSGSAGKGSMKKALGGVGPGTNGPAKGKKGKGGKGTNEVSSSGKKAKSKAKKAK